MDAEVSDSDRPGTARIDVRFDDRSDDDSVAFEVTVDDESDLEDRVSELESEVRTLEAALERTEAERTRLIDRYETLFGNRRRADATKRTRAVIDRIMAVARRRRLDDGR